MFSGPWGLALPQLGFGSIIKKEAGRVSCLCATETDPPRSPSLPSIFLESTWERPIEKRWVQTPLVSRIARDAELSCKPTVLAD